VGDRPLIVLDTHVLVWWVSGSRRLTAAARRAIARHVAEAPVAVSTSSMFEIATAIRRGRLELAWPAERWLAVVRLLPNIAFEPVSVAIAQIAAQLSDDFPGDPADRIIVATTLALDAKLVTADERLRGSGISVIW
jgi:PIN domain nuclease of toxin-antitoxin system